MLRGHSEQEGAVPAAEVDLQRTCRIGEDLGVLEFAKVIGGGRKERAWGGDG